MSLPLKDYRTAIPESVDVWLDIEAQATGKDKAAIGREIFTAWAKAKFHAHKVAARRLQANGMQPELFGDETEDDGSARKGRR
jgi:hypothetical protein